MELACPGAQAERPWACVCSDLLVGVPPGADAIPTPVNKAAYKSFMGVCLKIDEVRPQFLGLCREWCWGHKRRGSRGRRRVVPVSQGSRGCWPGHMELGT